MIRVREHCGWVQKYFVLPVHDLYSRFELLMQWSTTVMKQYTLRLRIGYFDEKNGIWIEQYIGDLELKLETSHLYRYSTSCTESFGTLSLSSNLFSMLSET